MVVPHHGGKAGEYKYNLIPGVKPKDAIISVGKKYGHPRLDYVRALKFDCFRVYKTPEESFKDHTEFLKRKRYAPLFELDKNDYKGWATGLKSAGYATNPRYAELLISLIERYNLNQFDRMETPREKIVREDKVLTTIAKNIPLEKKEEASRPRVIMKIHEVKSGDTITSLSKLYGINVDEIKRLNGLDDTNLKPGQLLVVSK
jgi:hypothetical protein